MAEAGVSDKSLGFLSKSAGHFSRVVPADQHRENIGAEEPQLGVEVSDFQILDK